MTYVVRRASAYLIVLSCLTCGCTTIEATRDASVRYNSAFANARNEILLLNILRASAQEPLQFSTISTVTGPMRGNVTVGGAIDNVLLGTSKVFNPSSQFVFRNPEVTLTPLDSKEFRQGMGTPVTAAQIDQLLAEGWDRAAVLNLVIAGVECPGQPPTKTDFTVLNDANPADQSSVSNISRFGLLAAKAKWKLGKTDDTSIGEFKVPAAEGMKAIKEGVGDSYGIAPVRAEAAASSMKIGMKESGQTEIEGLNFSDICGTAPEKAFVKVEADKSASASDGPKLLFRSPTAMVTYLGRLVALGQRRSEPYENAYFWVARAPPGYPMPDDSPYVPVRTKFHGTDYYIPAAGLRCGPEHSDCDKTLQTFGVLAEIIGLQTTQATLEQSKPTLTIGSSQ